MMPRRLIGGPLVRTVVRTAAIAGTASAVAAGVSRRRQGRVLSPDAAANEEYAWAAQQEWAARQLPPG